MPVNKVHHNTTKKARANGVEIATVYDSYSMTDTRYLGGAKAYISRDGESAAVMLERVLKAREDATARAVPLHEIVQRAFDAKAASDEDHALADEGDAAAAEDDDVGIRSIVKPDYKIEYDQHDGHANDDLAYALAEYTRTSTGTADPSRVQAVGLANGIDVNARWGHLNMGQRRMNCSNVLRARWRKGQPVVVGDRVLQK